MLSNNTSVARYAISAAVTAYDIDFPFWDFSEIVVTATNSATGESVILKKDIDYTITVSEAITDPVYQDGTVNMISNTYKSYDALVISRELPLTQDTDYKNSEPVNADTLEMSLDRATAQIQQVAEEAGHALKLPITENAGDYTMPEASQRQRKVLGFDDDGETIVMFSNPDDAIEQAEDANQQSQSILDQVTTLKEQTDDAKEAAEAAQDAAEAAESGAEQALQDTIQAKLDALEAIGETDTEGARGNAITSITNALNAALSAIGKTDDEGARKAALDAINAALTAALAAIGQDNSSGARGNAITAIAAALQSALSAIGQSNSTGARGDAISAIEAALQTALSSIQQTAETVNAEIDAKVEEAADSASAALNSQNAAKASENAAKASETASKTSETNAKQSETNAKNSETAAKTSEDNAAESESEALASKTAAKSSEDNAKISEDNAAESEGNALLYKNAAESAKTAAESARDAAQEAQEAAEKAAEDAAAIADIDIASPTAAGITKLYDEARGQNTDGAVSQKAINDELSDIDDALNDRYTKNETYSRTEIDNKLADAASILPIPLVSAEFTSTGTGIQIVMNNNYVGYGNVTVRYKIGEDPTKTDTIASFPITDVQSGTYYFRAFPEEGSLDEPSPSAIVALDTSKVMTPTYQWDDVTDSISFACQTPAADIRYTTDGLDPSATSGTPYTTPISLTSQTSFKVKAFKGGMADSDTLSVTITKVATPTFNFVKNGETGTVTMSCSTVGAVIKYTTDDSEPTENNGTVYSGAITLNGTSTKYRIKAFLSGCVDSEEIQGDAMFARIFGVRRKRADNTSPDWERLTPETDPLDAVTETVSIEPVPEITGTQSGQSIFDDYGPWQKKMRNFEDDGTPGAWHGDSGFSLTGKDVMVYYPDCYIKLVVSSDGYTYRYISDTSVEGFVKAPWSGMYGARYKTSNSNQSRSGATITVNQSIVTMRNNAKAKGTGWGLHDFVERCANEWLFIVEYASYDCQTKIGEGVSTRSVQIATGGTDAMTFHTGRAAGTATAVSVQYRYSEDLWGNTYDWCDGINVINGQTWVSTDWQNYQSDITEGYTQIGTALSGSNSGYISELVEDENNTWCCGVPKAFSGSDSTYITDYAYYYSGAYVLCVGGYFGDGSKCGLFYFRAHRSSSNTSSGTGSRLTYREASAA